MNTQNDIQRYFYAEKNYRCASAKQRIGLFRAYMSQQGIVYASYSIANPSFERFNNDRAEKVVSGRYMNEIDLGYFAVNRRYDVIRFVRETNNYFKSAPEGIKIKPLKLIYTEQTERGRGTNEEYLKQLLVDYDEYLHEIKQLKAKEALVKSWETNTMGE